MPFAIVTAQTLVAIAFGFALFKLWRVIAQRGPRFATLVAAGFLFRSLVGQVLFWISYLRLPVARGLQLGDGYWFWGLDGLGFFNLAQHFIDEGARAVLLIDKSTIAFFYVQAVAVSIVLLGASVAVGLLLNSIAFMGMSAMIVRWEVTRDHPTPALTALAIIWFTPSWLLWAVQPMKDAVFFFVFTAFFFALSRFCSELMKLRMRVAALVGWTAMMMAAVYATSGMRWYFGFMSWGLSCLAAALTFMVRRFGARRVVVVVAVLFLTAQAMVQGSGPYMPESIQRIFRPVTAAVAVVDAPASIKSSLEVSRETQQKVVGTTTLQEPAVLAKLGRGSRVERLAIGLSAMFIPPSIGTRAGLINVRGGRGLWLFTDIDTIVFDAAIVIACLVVFRRREKYGPVFWPLTAMTAALALAIAYVSTNYGTLMRHRAMVLMCIALLPLVRLPLGSAPSIDGDEDGSVHGSDERDESYAGS